MIDVLFVLFFALVSLKFFTLEDLCLNKVIHTCFSSFVAGCRESGQNFVEQRECKN